MKAYNAKEWRHANIAKESYFNREEYDHVTTDPVWTDEQADRYAREFAAEQLRLFAANWRPVPGMTSYQVADALEARAAELKG